MGLKNTNYQKDYSSQEKAEHYFGKKLNADTKNKQDYYDMMVHYHGSQDLYDQMKKERDPVRKAKLKAEADKVYKSYKNKSKKVNSR